jgi:hypothetical protein
MFSRREKPPYRAGSQQNERNGGTSFISAYTFPLLNLTCPVGGLPALTRGSPMSRNHGVCKALLAGFVAIGLTSTAFAQTSASATGLGQSWPNATDVSANPHWHVYVFVLNGVKYVQINDLNGTVHAAVGTAGGATIVLPVGVDAQNVTTPTTSAASSTAQVVYQDAATTVTATPQSSGNTSFAVQSLQSCPAYGCSGTGSPSP